MIRPSACLAGGISRPLPGALPEHGDALRLRCAPVQARRPPAELPPCYAKASCRQRFACQEKSRRRWWQHPCSATSWVFRRRDTTRPCGEDDALDEVSEARGTLPASGGLDGDEPAPVVHGTGLLDRGALDGERERHGRVDRPGRGGARSRRRRSPRPGGSHTAVRAALPSRSRLGRARPPASAVPAVAWPGVPPSRGCPAWPRFARSPRLPGSRGRP